MSVKKENGNRRYKDSLFRYLFKDKNNALELYNAVNGSDYKCADDLEVNTLKDVIYMKMKNDLSFIFGDFINLYEHQSSINPNMPLRGLMYLSELYHQIYGDDPRIYSSKILKIKTPKYVVFYNGDDNRWSDEVIKLRLSDAFETPLPATEIGDFEWTATVININKGKNAMIKNRSSVLSDYCTFIETVRELYSTCSFEEALDQAVQRCIENNVLTDLLSKHRMEVKYMVLTEFDEQKYTDMVRAEGKAEGLAEGEARAMVKMVETYSSKHKVDIKSACEELDISFEQYENAKTLIK